MASVSGQRVPAMAPEVVCNGMWLFFAALGKLGASLESLYADHAPSLLRQARRWGGPGVDADDVVHDVFLIAHQRIDDIDPEQSPGGYLFGVLRNVIREHRRRRTRQQSREENADLDYTHPPQPDETVQAQQRRQQLHACLVQLSDKQRHAVTLVDIENLSSRRAAELLGMSENALHANLSRGRKALMAAWAAQAETASDRKAS